MAAQRGLALLAAVRREMVDVPIAGKIPVGNVGGSLRFGNGKCCRLEWLKHQEKKCKDTHYYECTM
jgi:hypothetical protein